MPLSAMEQHRLEDLLDEIENLKCKVEDLLSTRNPTKAGTLLIEKELGFVYGIAGEMALNQDISWTNIVSFTNLKQQLYHHLNS